jgi:hypothetical protein
MKLNIGGRHFLCNIAEVGEILSKHHASTLLRSTPILSRATDVHLSEETLKRLMEDALATLSVIIDIAWRCVQHEIDIQAVMTLPMDFIVAVFRQENAQDMMTRARTARDVADQFAGANREAARLVVKNQIVRSVLLPWAERVIVEVGYTVTILSRQPVDDEQDPILRHFDEQYREFASAPENKDVIEVLRRNHPWYKERDGVKYFGRATKTFRSFTGLYKKNTQYLRQRKEGTRNSAKSKRTLIAATLRSRSKDMGPRNIFSSFRGGHTCPQRTRRLSADGFIFGKISSEMPLLVSESSRMRQSCCIRAHFRKLSKELSAILQWSTNFPSLLMSSLETSSG